MVPSGEQLANAEIIIEIGRQLGANDKQLLASIEAALVESALRNLDYGDRDSLGLFQQRPSQGWGTPSQVMDPYYAANAFFVGAGTNPGALEVSQAGTAGQLAQRVQRSAFPSRYDQRERDALQILSQLGGGNAAALPYENFFGIPVNYEYEGSGQGSWTSYLNSGEPMLLHGDRPLSESGSFGGIGTIVVLVVGVLVFDSLVNG